MKEKSPKVYTLAQVAKLLGIGKSTVYDYIKVGLIKVSANKIVGKSGRPGWAVPEAEYERLKRLGKIDSTGIKAMAAKLARRKASGSSAKKRRATGKTAAAAGPTKKRSAYTRGVTKKQVKRNAATTARAVAKKQTKRKPASTTAKKRKKL
jgi:hypothetical protein